MHTMWIELCHMLDGLQKILAAKVDIFTFFLILIRNFFNRNSINIGKKSNYIENCVASDNYRFGDPI